MKILRENYSFYLQIGASFPKSKIVYFLYRNCISKPNYPAMTYTFRHLPELILSSVINAVDILNSRKKYAYIHSSVQTWIWYSNIKYHIGKLREKL